MQDYIAYISEFGAAFLIVSIPFARKLYKELQELRIQKNKCDVKVAVIFCFFKIRKSKHNRSYVSFLL